MAFPEAPAGAEEFFCPSDDEDAVGPAGALAAERAATAANDMGKGAAALGVGPSDMIVWVLLVFSTLYQVNSIEFLQGSVPGPNRFKRKDTEKRVAAQLVSPPFVGKIPAN